MTIKTYRIIGGVIIAVAISTGVTSVLGAERMSTRNMVYDLEWTKLPNGREISPVFGNMKKGHHITLIKFSPGMKTAPHMHSNDYVGIVVSGTARHYQPGIKETKTPLPAGSTWAMPANVAHISECISATPCVFSIHQEGKFDLKAAK